MTDILSTTPGLFPLPDWAKDELSDLKGHQKSDLVSGEEGEAILDTYDRTREELVDRLTGRRVCEDCGANYHVEYSPPKADGVCDKCGGDLYQREDDKEETVRERLDVYREDTEPVLAHYEDHPGYVEIDGDQAPDDVWTDVRQAVRRTMRDLERE